MIASPAGSIALAALTLALVGACGGEPQVADSTPRIVASIHPVGDLVRSVAGPAARIEVLLPGGASPATFEVPPRLRARIQRADAFVLVGAGLDDWARAVLPEDRAAAVVRLTEGLELSRGHGHGGAPAGDPHVWLDPVRVRTELLPRITEVVEGVVPPGDREAVRRRAAALSDSLAALHREIEELMAPVASAAFVSIHAAWSYFAHRYGLVEVGPVWAGPGREPSARYLAELVNRARAAGVRAVFTEPQLAETAARALAEELDVPVGVLDPLGGPEREGREGYLELLRFNARRMAGALAPPEAP